LQRKKKAVSLQPENWLAEKRVDFGSSLKIIESKIVQGKECTCQFELGSCKDLKNRRTFLQRRV
jgi:hypothetical protein